MKYWIFCLLLVISACKEGAQPCPTTPEPTPIPVPEPTPVPTPAPEPPKDEVVSIPLEVIKQVDTRVIYVSSSAGKDSCDGLSPGCPKKKVSDGIALLRDKMPDHLLFKKGDVFDGGLGKLKKGGRSKTAQMLISSYGEGSRPKFVLSGSDGLHTNGGQLDHLVVSGLHFYGATKDPKSGSFTGKGPNGVQWLSSTEGLWIDDCLFEFAQVNIQSYSGSKLTNVKLTYNVVVDSYSTTGHAQGFYLDGIDGLYVADNVIDHNGFNESVSGANKTMFNHNVYIQHNNKNVQFVRNISMRASSHGVQIRPGGLVEDNFFYKTAIAVLIGYQGKSDQLVSGEIKNNVILKGTDISDALPRGFGLWAEYPKDVRTSGNVIAHVDTRTHVNDRALHEKSGVTNGVNYVWSWRVSNKDSKTSNLSWTPKDPSRSVESYQGSIGMPKTEQAFIEAVRGQSRDAYDLRYSPKKLYEYFKEGLMQ